MWLFLWCMARRREKYQEYINDDIVGVGGLLLRHSYRWCIYLLHHRAHTSECSSHAITWINRTRNEIGKIRIFLKHRFTNMICEQQHTWHSRLQYHWRWQSAQTNCASRFLQPWHSGNSLSLFLPKPDGPAISLFEYWSPSSITSRSTLSSASSSSCTK